MYQWSDKSEKFQNHISPCYHGVDKYSYGQDIHSKYINMDYSSKQKNSYQTFKLESNSKKNQEPLYNIPSLHFHLQYDAAQTGKQMINGVKDLEESFKAQVDLALLDLKTKFTTVQQIHSALNFQKKSETQYHTPDGKVTFTKQTEQVDGKKNQVSWMWDLAFFNNFTTGGFTIESINEAEKLQNQIVEAKFQKKGFPTLKEAKAYAQMVMDPLLEKPLVTTGLKKQLMYQVENTDFFIYKLASGPWKISYKYTGKSITYKSYKSRFQAASALFELAQKTTG